jgi:hypothetical protein
MVMDQPIPLIKPNKSLRSGKMMDHNIPQNKVLLLNLRFDDNRICIKI